MVIGDEIPTIRLFSFLPLSFFLPFGGFRSGARAWRPLCLEDTVYMWVCVCVCVCVYVAFFIPAGIFGGAC